MKNDDKTAEHLEMAAVKEDYHTHAADIIDWRVSKIDWLCLQQLVNYYLRILRCHYGTVVSEIGHPVLPYSLSGEEIVLSTCSVHDDDGGK
jgi:hypothetical protein